MNNLRCFNIVLMQVFVKQVQCPIFSVEVAIMWSNHIVIQETVLQYSRYYLIFMGCFFNENRRCTLLMIISSSCRAKRLQPHNVVLGHFNFLTQY